MDLVIAVFKVSVQERDEVFLLTFLVDLDVATTVQDVPLNLPSLLQSLEPNSVTLVKFSIFVSHYVSIQIMLLEERGLPWVHDLICAEHNEHDFVH